jgi:protein-ribulosamine 3-kinase
MIDASIKEYLNRFLNRNTGWRAIGGGCINDTYKGTDGRSSFFLKLNSAGQYPQMFNKEASALGFLKKQQAIRVPAVLGHGETGTRQWLLLEWIDTGSKTGSFWKYFGQQLAALHKIQAEEAGLDEDNYIGSLKQSNKRSGDWIDFFIEERLEPQIRLAQEKNILPSSFPDLFQQLCKRLPDIFTPEKFSLLHGDLWTGNFMCDETSQPVLIDPAVYFGHRSMDLAMTRLFGGFDKIFYDSYHYHFPLPSNYPEQWDVCNLYPLMVHVNLFGSGYVGQVESILKQFA